MRKQNLIGLMSVALLATACGKNMQVVTKVPVQTPKVTSASPVASNLSSNLSSGGTPALTGSSSGPGPTAGSLLPFSAFDMSTLKSDLLYVNAGDADNSIRAVGSPGFLVNGEAAKEGFVKSSNVVFRAILAVPSKAEMIKSVSKFKLVFHGVRMYDDGTGKPEDVLAKQVLCVVEPNLQKCAGGKIDLADKNVNGAWKSVQQTDATLSDISNFKTIYEMENNARVYAYVGGHVPDTVATSTGVVKPTNVISNNQNLNGTGEPADFEIDIQKAFNIADKDLPQWILDNSTVYDSSGNYRKFRFELANNIYAKSGELDLTIVNADASSFVVNAPGNPVNPNDVNSEDDYKNGIKVDESTITSTRIVVKKLDDSAFGFETPDGQTVEKLSDVSINKLTSLAQKLVGTEDNIEEIHISVKMDVASDKAKSQKTAQTRADLIKAELVSLEVKASILANGGVEETSACTVGSTSCEKDRTVSIGFQATEASTVDQIDTLKTNLDLSLGQ